MQTASRTLRDGTFLVNCGFRFVDITGNKFGRLTVVKFYGMSPNSKWVCRCDCGKEKIVSSNSLRMGRIRSCGCLARELTVKRETTHGGTDTPEYQIWCGIKQRCLNPKSNVYIHYGGRGIKICDRWLHSFGHFISDMGRRPDKLHTIDRIDNNGDYCPENCRWATIEIQLSNRQTSVYLEFNGENLTAAQWDKRMGYKRGTTWYRIRAGWEAKKILTTPPKRIKYANTKD